MTHTIYKYVPYKNEDEALMSQMLCDLQRIYSFKAIAKGTGIKAQRIKKSKCDPKGLTFNNDEFRSVLAFYLKERFH